MALNEVGELIHDAPKPSRPRVRIIVQTKKEHNYEFRIDRKNARRVNGTGFFATGGQSECLSARALSMWAGYYAGAGGGTAHDTKACGGTYTLRARQSANRRQRNCNKVLFGFPNNFAYCLTGKVSRSRIRLAQHVHRVKRFPKAR